MDAAIETAIASNQCPGGVLWLERNGTAYHKAYGNRALVPKREPMTEDTIFDMASLTKVVATTPAIMLLVERGQVKLEAPVRTYIPEFTGDEKDLVTVRELLTHTSGLPPDIETKTDWHGWNDSDQKGLRGKIGIAARHGFQIQRHQFHSARRNRPARQQNAAAGFCSTRNLRAVENDRHGIFAAEEQNFRASRRRNLSMVGRASPRAGSSVASPHQKLTRRTLPAGAAWFTTQRRGTWAAWPATPDFFRRRPIWRATRG